MFQISRPLLGAAVLACTSFAASSAQVVPVPAQPQIGSSNPAPLEPPVARPTSTPCSVPLFTNLQFADYGTKPISFTPAAGAGCAGPWAKVVLTADFTVTAGRQFDRTAKFFLGGANIYFGTTAEPRAALAPSWHIERDVTDLSALFQTSQTGIASIQNIVNSTYTGVIYASATLVFYPADAANPAPVVPSAVLSLSNNTTTSVDSTASPQSATFTLPRNIERAYLDVISQSQRADEFWYTCVPSSVADALQNCGNTGFRETEVAIDGVPAGVAPVYPWIYTGGLDPYLWEPVPGVETLNFKPYRVDLSPFAGRLSDGQSHTVTVSVFNSNGGFDVASTLLLYTDPGAATVTGDVSVNTLAAAPSPQVETSLNTAADGTVSGPVTVRSARDWFIAGYVNTSHGRVDTTIRAFNTFSNQQDEKVSNAEYKQGIRQDTAQQEVTTITSGAGTVQTQHDISFPLTVNYRQAYNGDGSLFIATYVKQQKTDALRSPLGANSPNPVVVSEAVETQDTLHYNAAGSFTGHDNNFSTASYGAKDAQGRCVARSLAANQLVLTQAQDSASCSLVP